MISVTNDFKTAARQPTKQWHAYVVDNEVYPDEITDQDDLKSLKITAETSILRTIMRRAEAVYFGSHNYLDLYVNLGIGIVLPDTSTEEIDYGQFKVVSAESNQGTGETKIKMFDKMYESLVLYDLDPIYDITFPATLSELLQAICTRLGWALATGSDTFPNSTFEMASDTITDTGMTFRDVLDDIAEAGASIIYFDVNDELVVKQIAHDTPLETLDADVLEVLKVETEFGPVNSIVLARTPQEDNILDKDQTSIDANGLTEIKIENNLLVDDDRVTAVTPILTELLGLEFYPFEADNNGLGYIQIGDRIAVEDVGENQFEVVVFGFTINMTGGIKETLKAVRPDKLATDYQTAGIVGQRIRNTEIKVDKQNGIITLINADVSDLESLVTQLIQTTEDIQINISGVGGTNLLKNSVGLKGDLLEWQVLDEDNEPLDVRNDGTIVQSSDVISNSESGSAILIENQFITQTFPTIVGEEYTFYCRFNKSGDCDITLDDITFPLTVDGYSDNTWGVFSYQLIATQTSTTLVIENAGIDSALLTDLVVKLGDASNWTQAPNEVYGSNFKFDKDGLEITSLTDAFKTILDNSRLIVIDTSGGVDSTVMEVSKDRATINRLVVQNTLTIQRQGNPSKGAKIIPTATGAMLVINE